MKADYELTISLLVYFKSVKKMNVLYICVIRYCATTTIVE